MAFDYPIYLLELSSEDVPTRLARADRGDIVVDATFDQWAEDNGCKSIVLGTVPDGPEQMHYRAISILQEMSRQGCFDQLAYRGETSIVRIDRFVLISQPRKILYPSMPNTPLCFSLTDQKRAIIFYNAMLEAAK